MQDGGRDEGGGGGGVEEGEEVDKKRDGEEGGEGGNREREMGKREMTPQTSVPLLDTCTCMYVCTQKDRRTVFDVS